MKLKEFLNGENRTQNFNQDTKTKDTTAKSHDDLTQFFALEAQYKAEKILSKLSQSENP